jgi:hypothetical protein
MSTFGVMFNPGEERAAAQMLHVCRGGGRIALANWTAQGFIGQLFKTLGTHLPPPAGVKSPALWGTRARLDELFAAQASNLQVNVRDFVFRYRSPQHWMDVLGTYYGPLLNAFAALEGDAGERLRDDILALIARFNRCDDGALVLPSEYVEVVITWR